VSTIPPTAISFGNVITGDDVLTAVQSTIDNWIGTYLALMARHVEQDPTTEGGVLPSFKSYPASLDISRFPEDQLPACIIVVPSITDAPEKKGNGSYIANFQVGIGVAVSAPTRARTLKLAQLYAAAVRLLIIQKRSLGGFAMGVTWTREEYTGNILRSDDMRTMAIGVLEFTVQVDNVANNSQGPEVPIPNNAEPTGWATIETTNILLDADVVGTEL
jgi:hypothetical protein